MHEVRTHGSTSPSLIAGLAAPGAGCRPAASSCTLSAAMCCSRRRCVWRAPASRGPAFSTCVHQDPYCRQWVGVIMQAQAGSGVLARQASGRSGPRTACCSLFTRRSHLISTFFLPSGLRQFQRQAWSCFCANRQRRGVPVPAAHRPPASSPPTPSSKLPPLGLAQHKQLKNSKARAELRISSCPGTPWACKQWNNMVGWDSIEGDRAGRGG